MAFMLSTVLHCPWVTERHFRLHYRQGLGSVSPKWPPVSLYVHCWEASCPEARPLWQRHGPRHCSSFLNSQLPIWYNPVWRSVEKKMMMEYGGFIAFSVCYWFSWQYHQRHPWGPGKHIVLGIGPVRHCTSSLDHVPHSLGPSLFLKGLVCLHLFCFVIHWNIVRYLIQYLTLFLNSFLYKWLCIEGRRVENRRKEIETER